MFPTASPAAQKGCVVRGDSERNASGQPRLSALCACRLQLKVSLSLPSLDYRLAYKVSRSPIWNPGPRASLDFCGNN